MANKILIIEDEETIRDNLSKMLSIKGYDVKSAANGKDGVMEAIFSRPDLILCDIMMPEMDGYEVVTQIRKNDDLRNIPFIFLTAKIDRKDVRKGMNMGADDYITKPFTMDELFNAINVRLEKTNKLNEELENNIANLSKEMRNNTSHEFRTPLTGILCTTNLLLEHHNRFNSNKLVDLLNIIRKSAERLQRTTENIILYQTLVTLDYNANAEISLTTGISSIFNEVINSVIKKIANTYSIKTAISVNVENSTLAISDKNLKIILCEIIDNAHKFSSPNSNIIIGGKSYDNTYILTIENTGIKFQSEYINKIGPFIQFNREKFAQQGSGLGLFITKSLIELNKGTLLIKNESKTIVELHFAKPH